MNMGKMRCSKPNSTTNGLFNEEELTGHGQSELIENVEIKRNSLHNEKSVVDQHQMKALKRHQSINKPVLTENIASMLKPSNMALMNGNARNIMMMMNMKIGENKSNHQISLDSGIYLPSESEDCSFQLNVA